MWHRTELLDIIYDEIKMEMSACCLFSDAARSQIIQMQWWVLSKSVVRMRGECHLFGILSTPVSATLKLCALQPALLE
jgi:hypothetical protein